MSIVLLGYGVAVSFVKVCIVMLRERESVEIGFCLFNCVHSAFWLWCYCVICEGLRIPVLKC